ncbi:MAG: 3-hydroxyacyl-CoA dehydrogenase [Betaproteobacteria bacterium]|nr:3-hydroxyacyl-CoA dehydrogenase [Betaproteobacteria bacterium]
MSSGIERIAVVGGGLIGSSMARLFVENGLKVTIYEPDKAARGRLDQTMRGWALGSRVPAIHAELEAALCGAQFVLEAAPERLPLKQALLKEMEIFLAKDVVIATATSSLLVSDMQVGMVHPNRLVAAHPFNPPHLIPLIEVAGSESTSEEALATTYGLFKAIGRRPVRLKREAIGHIANRLTSALYQEAVHIVSSGIASVADVDDAVRYGPGIRWAVMGPHMLYHLGAGEGGYAKYLKHLGPTQEARWASLGKPRLDDSTRQMLIDGVNQEAAGRDIEQLCADRDQGLLAILQALAALNNEPLNEGIQ